MPPALPPPPEWMIRSLPPAIWRPLYHLPCLHFVELGAAALKSHTVRRETFTALDENIDGFCVPFDALFESHTECAYSLVTSDDRGLVTYLRSFSFARSAAATVENREDAGVMSMEMIGDAELQKAIADVFSEYRCVGIHDYLGTRSQSMLDKTGGYPIDMLLLPPDEWLGPARDILMNSRFVVLYLDLLMGGVATELKLLRTLGYQDRTLVALDLQDLKDPNIFSALVGLFGKLGADAEVVREGGRTGDVAIHAALEALDDFPMRFPYSDSGASEQPVFDVLSLIKTEVVDKGGPSKFHNPLGVDVGRLPWGLTVFQQIPRETRSELLNSIEPLRASLISAVKQRDLLGSLQDAQRLITILFLCGTFDMLASCFALLHCLADMLGVSETAKRNLARAVRARRWAGDSLSTTARRNVDDLVRSWSDMLD